MGGWWGIVCEVGGVTNVTLLFRSTYKEMIYTNKMIRNWKKDFISDFLNPNSIEPL